MYWSINRPRSTWPAPRPRRLFAVRDDPAAAGLPIADGVALAFTMTGCDGDETSVSAPLPAPVSVAASPSATPTTTPPSPSPTPTMTRKEACQQVVESAVDWVHLASRFSDDPTLESINSMEVSGLADKIRETLPYLDDATAELARDMMYPLDILYGVMTTGVNQTIELEEGRSAVPDVMRKCRGKANLKGYESPYES